MIVRRRSRRGRPTEQLARRLKLVGVVTVGSAWPNVSCKRLERLGDESRGPVARGVVAPISRRDVEGDQADLVSAGGGLCVYKPARMEWYVLRLRGVFGRWRVADGGALERRCAREGKRGVTELEYPAHCTARIE